MKHWKRIAIILLAVFMLSAVVACKDNANKQDNGQGSSQETSGGFGGLTSGQVIDTPITKFD